MFKILILLLIFIHKYHSLPYFIDDKNNYQINTISSSSTSTLSMSASIENDRNELNIETTVSTTHIDHHKHHNDEYDNIEIKQNQELIHKDEHYLQLSNDKNINNIDDLHQETLIHEKMNNFKSSLVSNQTTNSTNETITVETSIHQPPLDYSNDENDIIDTTKYDQNKNYDSNEFNDDEKVSNKITTTPVATVIPKDTIIRSTFAPFKEPINQINNVINDNYITSTTTPPTTTTVSSTSTIPSILSTSSSSTTFIPPHPLDVDELSIKSIPSGKNPLPHPSEEIQTTSISSTTYPSTTPMFPQFFNKKPNKDRNNIKNDNDDGSVEFIKPVTVIDQTFWENFLDSLKCAMRDCSGVLIPTKPPEKEHLSELSMTRFARGHESGLTSSSSCPCVKLQITKNLKKSK